MLKSNGYTTLKRRITLAKKQKASYSHHEPVVILPLESAKEIYETINGLRDIVPFCNNLESAMRGNNMTPKQKERAIRFAMGELKETLVILNKIT